jgi:hypothetical protein
MMKKLLLIVIVLFAYSTSQARTLPKEGSGLNYRIIGFQTDSLIPAKHYLLQIAIGHYYTTDSFTKNIILSIPTDSNRLIAEVPYWAYPYTWRMVALPDSAQWPTTQLHHFYTSLIPDMDTTKYRLTITHKAKKFKDALVFLDNNRALYDMNGNMVWYLPDKNFKDLLDIHTMPDMRDLKLTEQSTLTYMLNGEVYEIDINGKLLWKGPNTGEVVGDNTERYNHQFSRLSNGHYMVLGLQKDVAWPPDPKQGIRNTFGTIIEYNEKGHVVWSWKTSNYLPHSDLMYFQSTTDSNNKALYLQENSFYVDSLKGFIYLSCRNISRIIKIKYPEGNVVAIYGQKFSPTQRQTNSNGLFCNQHSIQLLKNGNLCFYNNNTCKTAAPELIIAHPNKKAAEGLDIVWRFDCSFNEDFSKKDKMRGGNVLELEDGSLFASMGGEFGRSFIVNMNKEIIWSALPEEWNFTEKHWMPRYQYRCSIITQRHNFEKLLWAQE